MTYEGTKREVATDKGTLRYHEAGDGPPLILLHGSGIGVSGWRNYRGNLEVFAKHFHCYILEFPGFGVSDPVDGHPVITAASSVVRFMDALGIESAAMIGNSMGGGSRRQRRDEVPGACLQAGHHRWRRPEHLQSESK